MEITVLFCLVGALGLIGLVILTSAIRIVQEYERLVVFRLGRSVGERGPGLVLLIPFIDRGVKVDLREQVRDIPHQTSITKDNAPIAIDFLWYYKVLHAVDSVLQVGNFEAAAQGMATTTLRSVIGGILLDDVLSQREHINQLLRTRLDEVTERWGVKVTSAGGDEPPDDGGTRAPRRGDRVDGHARGCHQRRRGRQAGQHSQGRRREAIQHPAGGRREAVPAVAGGGLLLGPEGNLCRRRHRRPEDDDSPVLRNPEVDGRQPGHQIHLPARVHQPDRRAAA
jgi:hypothetical protein